ncbi:MAG: hypothetical protein QXK19_01870 [Nitrososphaerota archaeon]
MSVKTCSLGILLDILLVCKYFILIDQFYVEFYIEFYLMAYLQDLYEVGYDLDYLIKKMVASGRGMIETVVVVSRDLSVLALEVGHSVSLDELTSAGAIIISAFSNILREVSLCRSEKIRIELKDKRYLIIQSYIDYFLICMIEPNSRLGFIDLVLEYYKPLLYEVLYPSHNEISEIDSFT